MFANKKYEIGVGNYIKIECENYIFMVQKKIFFLQFTCIYIYIKYNFYF